MKNGEQKRQDLRNLASGVGHALQSLNEGKHRDFLLVVIEPDADGTSLLSTVASFTDPAKTYLVGTHLIDMAKAQSQQEPSLDPHDDADVRGHA